MRALPAITEKDSYRNWGGCIHNDETPQEYIFTLRLSQAQPQHNRSDRPDEQRNEHTCPKDERVSIGHLVQNPDDWKYARN